MWTGVRNLTTQTRQNIREQLQAEIAALTESIHGVDEAIMEIDEETTSNISGSNGGDGVERVEDPERPDGDARYRAVEGSDDDSFDPSMRITTNVEATLNTSPEGPRRGVQAEGEDVEPTLTNVTALEVGSRDSIPLPSASSSILAANRTEHSSTRSP
jgi:hypothetical protein